MSEKFEQHVYGTCYCPGAPVVPGQVCPTCGHTCETPAERDASNEQAVKDWIAAHRKGDGR